MLFYINGMTGPYCTIAYVTKMTVVHKRNDDWKESPLIDRNGNVVK
ncbi:MAG: hypothetical protein LBT03_00100 [Holosporales bacterium]|nr:hypothetical protein [Holosporales bacterium]